MLWWFFFKGFMPFCSASHFLATPIAQGCLKHKAARLSCTHIEECEWKHHFVEQNGSRHFNLMCVHNYAMDEKTHEKQARTGICEAQTVAGVRARENVYVR